MLVTYFVFFNQLKVALDDLLVGVLLVESVLDLDGVGGVFRRIIAQRINELDITFCKEKDTIKKCFRGALISENEPKT